ncbi:short transient receptor potential channel 3-like isoform X2 [Castor canadensis]|uniref:Short transient receptor potential channel 3-like isoform X2 n=1 Tax=Castor canadensis TaxID=51338 RepID=A0AC58MTE8_CASCN
MLLLKGIRIQQPHDYFCKCSDCTEEQWHNSHWMTNVCKGQTSPVYLSLSSDVHFLSTLEPPSNAVKRNVTRLYHYPCAAGAGTLQDFILIVRLCPEDVDQAPERYWEYFGT